MWASAWYRTSRIFCPSSPWNAALFLALGDEGVERFGGRRIQRRRLILGEQPFPDRIGALRGVVRARFAPGFEVAPVGEDRLIERSLVARKGVRFAEKMPARRHAADSLQRQR